MVEKSFSCGTSNKVSLGSLFIEILRRIGVNLSIIIMIDIDSYIIFLIDFHYSIIYITTTHQRAHSCTRRVTRTTCCHQLPSTRCNHLQKYLLERSPVIQHHIRNCTALDIIRYPYKPLKHLPLLLHHIINTD